jgi:hypothetical protein
MSERTSLRRGRRRGIDSLVARLIVDGDFSDLARTDWPAAVASCALDPKDRSLAAQTDVPRVVLFAGLVAKVHHTYLWGLLPISLALLKKADLELRIFARYAPVYRRRLHNSRLTPDEKTTLFVAFAISYLAELQTPTARLISDVLRFESFASSPRATDIASTPPTPQVALGCDEAVPQRACPYDVAQYAYPVLAAMPRWKGGEFDYVPDPGDTFVVVSGGASTGLLRFIDVDRVSAAILNSVDDSTSVAGLAGQLVGSRSAATHSVVSHVRQVLREAAEIGLVRIDV